MSRFGIGILICISIYFPYICNAKVLFSGQQPGTSCRAFFIGSKLICISQKGGDHPRLHTHSGFRLMLSNGVNKFLKMDFCNGLRSPFFISGPQIQMQKSYEKFK